jgi:hypothetical protein
LEKAQCPPPGIRSRHEASRSRISSAVLVQMNGCGLSFHWATQARMSRSNACRFLWTPGRSRIALSGGEAPDRARRLEHVRSPQVRRGEPRPS